MENKGFDVINGEQYENEDKDKICKVLCVALQFTRAGSDLISLDYDSRTEIVTARFKDDSMGIIVAGESGIEMVRDIMDKIFR